jgi:hypothetical protein
MGLETNPMANLSICSLLICGGGADSLALNQDAVVLRVGSSSCMKVLPLHDYIH